jgi:hypothetical protein
MNNYNKNTTQKTWSRGELSSQAEPLAKISLEV